MKKSSRAAPVGSTFGRISLKRVIWNVFVDCQRYEKTLSFLPDSAKNHYLCTD